MPPVSEYVLKGGPCDGKTGQLTGAIADSGEVTCSGHIYKVDQPIVIVSGREEFTDAGPIPKPKSVPVAAHAHHGWNDLAHTVNKKWHPALTKRGKLQAAALQSLRSASRVRF